MQSQELAAWVSHRGSQLAAFSDTCPAELSDYNLRRGSEVHLAEPYETYWKVKSNSKSLFWATKLLGGFLHTETWKSYWEHFTDRSSRLSVYTYKHYLCCCFFFPGGLIVSMEARGLTGASLSFSRLRGKKVDCRPAVNFLLSKYSY